MTLHSTYDFTFTFKFKQQQKTRTGFPLYFGIEIQGLSKLHFQGPILDGSLQHGQYYSDI